MSPGYMPPAGKSDWRTPPEVLAVVAEALGGSIITDPCPPEDPAHHFAQVNLRDGLEEPWPAAAFVNPPFDALDRWAAACAAQNVERGCEVILLLPARTDTRYWHEAVATARAICFWRGRLKFVGAPTVAPFPVAFAYWGAWPWRFHEVFSKRGMVVAP